MAAVGLAYSGCRSSVVTVGCQSAVYFSCQCVFISIYSLRGCKTLYVVCIKLYIFNGYENASEKWLTVYLNWAFLPSWCFKTMWDHWGVSLTQEYLAFIILFDSNEDHNLENEHYKTLKFWFLPWPKQQIVKEKWFSLLSLRGNCG